MWLGSVDTNCKQSLNIVPKVYNRLQSSLCHLPGLGQVGHSPREPVGVLGPWTGAQCDEAPGPPATKCLTNPKPDRLIFCHMAGWLASCSWQAGWLADCLSNKMSTWSSLPPNIRPTPSLTSWYFVTWLVGWPVAAGKLADCLSNKMPTCPPLGRDILWPCVWLLWSHRPVVRCS